jgi:hypothetical protein
MRRRVWCETLSFAEMLDPAVIKLLSRDNLDILVAVRPQQVEEAADAVSQLQGHGLFVGAWPMLDNQDGRWASASSMLQFVEFADRVAQLCGADEIVVDLEPPFDRMKNWKTMRAAPKTSPQRTLEFARARDELAASVQSWRARGLRVTTAVIPLVAWDLKSPRGGLMQRLLGTPVDALSVDAHSVMAYSSLFEGWSRGLVNRSRAEWMLRMCARRTAQRWGERGGLSLGTVAAGAFGDEPSYRDVSELRRDVELATAAGIAELSLFDLGGVVRSRDPYEWINALVGRL